MTDDYFYKFWQPLTARVRCGCKPNNEPRVETFDRLKTGCTDSIRTMDLPTNF